MVTKASFLMMKTGKRKDAPWDNGWMNDVHIPWDDGSEKMG